MSENLADFKYKYEYLTNRYNGLLKSLINIRDQMSKDNDDDLFNSYISQLSSIEKNYCIHDLKPDYSYFDPCKTIYSCSICGYHTI